MALHNGHSVPTTNGHSNGASNGTSAAVPIVDPTAMRRPVGLSQGGVRTDHLHRYSIVATSIHENTSLPHAIWRVCLEAYQQAIEFKTERQVPTTGLMLVGWGGNNGTTVTATHLGQQAQHLLAHREGIQTPNYIGSISVPTVRLGSDAQPAKMFIFRYLTCCQWSTQRFGDRRMGHQWHAARSGYASGQSHGMGSPRSTQPIDEPMKPLPSYQRQPRREADNVLPGNNKQAHLDQIRKDIRDFKAANKLDKVIVLWTANTERYSELIPGINDTARNLEKAVVNNHDEVSPSTIFAMACIYEGVPYINGAPQNTFVPGCIQLAEELGGFIGGDDFKSGQTKIKSCLAEFLVNSGIKPLSIASYNHLGNNDGRNLNAQKTFRSKEISKSSVVDDMVEANHLLYKPLLEAPKGEKKIEGGGQTRKTEHPDHCVVIKYMPSVGDDKVALDEYYSELAMGGRNKIVISNTCQDSLLAIPLIIDLVIITELLTRVQYRKPSGNSTEESDYQKIYPVLSLLSSMLKAPLVKPARMSSMVQLVNGRLSITS
ncbi:hypothetical protein H4Q26_003841 [Puccinia striiformis f. sp. tritici PST-130]|nr:hypothetical protein H4Q26_003841 [Puccinia striiformis f. sp. tritici PST-130]